MLDKTGHAMQQEPVRPRALLSVWDKRDIIPFAQGLTELGFELLSTGGTARTLREAGLTVTDVSEATGHPEIFDGRVKSLHPAIHGPLLARLEREDDAAHLKELGYPPIQVVAVNLYPFAEAAAKEPPLAESELLEMIDIGGPTLVRASAKNHRNVLIVVRPERYTDVLDALRSAPAPEAVGLELRQALALEAFQQTSGYDTAIVRTLHERWIGAPESVERVEDQADRLPAVIRVAATQCQVLRYGENAHQAAALFVDAASVGDASTLVGAQVEGGKAMSYNNYADADACLRLCRSLSTEEWPEAPHACVIVKHANPCGAALGATQEEAFAHALASDPESAFGSIIAFNTPVTLATAEAIGDLFVEVVMAPAYDEDARAHLRSKSNRRLLTLASPGDRLAPLERTLVHKPIEGGWLMQTEEPPRLDLNDLSTVTARQMDAADAASMRFAARVCEQVKSNAIVMVQGLATVGIGPGQTSRVEAVRIASRRAGERAQGCVLASDAFFPFPDGVEQAAEAGARLIVQPGGSIRDEQVIAAADALGVAMVFTGRRLFRH
ncbi:MAG: bifunctional phosphoribosylaminoimidazolecarboxamide formyltransferase/IMP cyclohydrolase [Candidatus Poseidoniaceae archaeon]